MKMKTSLLRGAALGALIALGLGAAAQAKTVRHHHTPPAGPSLEQQQIQALQEQNAMLVQRINALEAQQQQTAAAAAAAQQAAQSAQAAQVQADTEIKRIPGEVQTAVAALPKPKPGWESSTSVNGRMYYDITSITEKSDGVTPSPARNGVNFDIKRFYVGIDHKFNDTFSANITTDFTYDGAVGATQIYIKKAYLQAKLSDAMVFRLGSTDLPWVPFVEDIYGYRYVENVMIDRDKFGTSADWGVHVSGKVPAGMVTFNYALAAVNGAGYKKPGFGTGNRSQGVDFEGRVSATADHFTVAVGGYTGKLGKDVKNGPTTYVNASRFDALVAYTNDRIRLGGEYFYASDWNDVTQANPALRNSSEGFSGFGSFKVTPQVAVFGRYDWVKPRRDTSPSLHDNYFNVGVSYSPAKIVDFALVYKRDKVDNGIIGTSNGNVGGIVDGTYDEVGLWSQFRW